MSFLLKSIFSPFSFWKNFFKKPTTIRYPKEDLNVFDKPGISPGYRGLHTNDLDKCLGCGTCEDICPTAAIKMKESSNIGEGKLGKEPKIDYGRCCFCGFCVDVCPSASLNMTRDYIYKLETPVDQFSGRKLDTIKEHFDVIPSTRDNDSPGFVTPDELSWLDLDRTGMDELKPKERYDSFIEIVKGYSKEQALKEAERCVECGVCKETCPAHMNIPEYIKAIWDDDLEESVRQIYMDNPLPNVCGRVCTHKCETVCSLIHRGDPVAIRWLKRYAVDNLNTDQIILLNKEIQKKENKKKIAIIGSGPTGLSCAYYLVLLGYDITIYESDKKPGGVPRYGVPNYRLPFDALDRDIEIIKSLGVTIKTGVTIGKDISIDDIRKKHDAVYLATGFTLGNSTGIDNIGRKGYRANELLAKIMEGKKVPLGRKIVVIGGGNVAYDIARSLARLQRKELGQVNVQVMSLEGECELPADLEEIEEGRQEGVDLNPQRSPREVILDKKGNVKGIKTVLCTCVFDPEGRFNPQCDLSDVKTYDADMIVEAVGQRPDYSLLGKYQDKLKYERGRVSVNKKGQSDLDWLFAGGDIVHGPDIIHAIADGHNAAQGIDGFLKRKK
jgi:glutamate synthase (NADPH/NADH) small chain